MTGTFNAEMMIIARQARGFSQTRLAKELHVSQSTISKIEAGYTVPDISFAEKLAHTLNFLPSFFMREGRLRPAPANYHRKRQKLSASDWEQILARSEVFRMCVEIMLRSVELVPTRPAPPAIDADRYDGRMDRVADAVRQAWLLPRGPVTDVTALIEDAGILIIPFDFGTELIDAFCQHAVDGLPPLIFLNTRIKGKDRIRFSLLHELCHLVAHRVSNPEMEHEANQFAAAFLMPETDIRHALYGMSMEKLMVLKLHWKASMQAILYRARDLHRLTERGYRYYQITLSKRGWRSKEPVEIEGTIENPRLLKRLVATHLGELGYSQTDMSELFGIVPADLTQIVVPDRPRLKLVT